MESLSLAFVSYIEAKGLPTAEVERFKSWFDIINSNKNSNLCEIAEIIKGDKVLQKPEKEFLKAISLSIIKIFDDKTVKKIVEEEVTPPQVVEEEIPSSQVVEEEVNSPQVVEEENTVSLRNFGPSPGPSQIETSLATETWVTVVSKKEKQKPVPKLEVKEDQRLFAVVSSFLGETVFCEICHILPSGQPPIKFRIINYTGDEYERGQLIEVTDIFKDWDISNCTSTDIEYSDDFIDKTAVVKGYYEGKIQSEKDINFLHVDQLGIKIKAHTGLNKGDYVKTNQIYCSAYFGSYIDISAKITTN